MGLDDADLMGSCFGGKTSSVFCSICLEGVTDDGKRSWAKLQCGHVFHLDCIGSAFNVKGVMQCPNCRKVEKGQWLFANGGHSCADYGIDDWAYFEDLYDLGYSEMAFGIHWCPFNGITRLPSSFDEREFSSASNHEFNGQHLFFSEHAAVSSTSHPCPDFAYFRPVHHVTSSNSNRNITDGFTYSLHWDGSSMPNELPPLAFPAMDVHYLGWDHLPSLHVPNSHINGAEQPPISSTGQRVPMTNSEVSRSGSSFHPIFVHGSAARAGSLVAASVIPPYPIRAAFRDRIQALQAYFQPSNSPVTRILPSNAQRSSGQRVSAPISAIPSDQTNGFYPMGPSGQSFQEADNSLSSQSRNWERQPLSTFASCVIDRDVRGRVLHQASWGSDTGVRSSSFHRH